MNISSMIKSTAVLLILSVVAVSAFAGGQKEQVVVPPPGERYAYVWVTGSLIPQKVVISPIGTTTNSPVWAWDRRMINQTGRGTVEGVLKQDPSLSIIMGRRSGF
jgi:hypothetical protein